MLVLPFCIGTVVSKTRGGLPAPGFFDCARRLGRFRGNADGEDARLLMEAAEQEAEGPSETPPLPETAEHRGWREIPWLLPERSAAPVRSFGLQLIHASTVP